MDEIEAQPSGYKLIIISSGSFLMGSPNYESGRSEHEGPLHRVEVRSFHFGRFPVTNEDYQKFLSAAPNIAREPDLWNDRDFNQPKQPVVGVSFEDAIRYCKWAGLRLPSEAEWEYACRAGSTARYCNGERKKDLSRVAWYSRVAKRRLHNVGKKEPNAFGLYDMHGNVWEWCADDWHDSYEGAPSDGIPWLDRDPGEERVLRGGSWFGNTADYLRSATRHRGLMTLGDFNIGFRCAL